MTKVNPRICTLLSIGCAGWNTDAFFAKLPKETSHLERYSTVLRAVEINSSFYRSHRSATYTKWRELVPPDFRFSVKLPKQITHLSRLNDVDNALCLFMDGVSHLEEKLGCLLVQLPPSLQYDRAIAEKFFERLRTLTATSIACEPRHVSWSGSQASDTFESYNISPVLADPPIVNFETNKSSLCAIYIRLHGSPVIYRSAYSAEFLANLHTKIEQWQNSGRNVWCIFDNTANGAALPNALDLAKRCDISKINI